MDINELVGVWAVVLQEAGSGELRKSDVVEALRSGEPIPTVIADRVMPLLADVVDGEYSFNRGPKPKGKLERMFTCMGFDYMESDLRAAREYLKKNTTHEDLERLKNYIENGGRAWYGWDDESWRGAVEKLQKKGETPYSIVLELTAEKAGVSTRRIEQRLESYRSTK